jgi:hypothetical protein
MSQVINLTHWRRWLTVLGLFVGLLIATGCADTQTAAYPDANDGVSSPVDGSEAAVDEAAVYATVIERIYTVDDTFGGELKPAQLYLLSQTDDTIGGPDIDPMPSAMVDEAAQQAILGELSDLPTQLMWVDDRADVPMTPEGGVEGDGAIITLGNIHPQDDGTLMVPGSIFIGNLAAGGQTFILTPTDAGWTITGTTGEWVS